MVMAGLLWYDDDMRRPLATKILEAVERYRERVGFEPTVCQLSPEQLTALAASTSSHGKRPRNPAIELPRTLRLEPDEHLHPNYFMLGMGEGDIAIPIAILDDEASPRRARRAKQTLTAENPEHTSRKPATPRASTEAATKSTHSHAGKAATPAKLASPPAKSATTRRRLAKSA